MREYQTDLTLEIQRTIARIGALTTSVGAISLVLGTLSPVPAPFAGAGTGDGIVGDPGGLRGAGRYLDDTGGFSVPSGVTAGGSGHFYYGSCADPVTLSTYFGGLEEPAYSTMSFGGLA